MDHMITICEARNGEEISLFWEQLYSYFRRDLFPDPDDEDLEYFLGEEYRQQMQLIHDREQDRCYYLQFWREGQQVGFAMPVLYTSQEGKCFIMEFCVYPEFRGNGMGTACAAALLNWTKDLGATYWELNSGGVAERTRFWHRVGFRENGFDEWGEPLMLMPPEDVMPITVEPLEDPEDWQLYKLMNGYRMNLGQPCLTEEAQEQLSRDIQQGRVTVALAKRGSRAVGLRASGEISALYVEPVFCNEQILRLLNQANKI